jgi:anaphase-promoting complex subunit 11
MIRIGDDCPPVWGQCGHALHMQCIMKWLGMLIIIIIIITTIIIIILLYHINGIIESQQNLKQECPMCRQPWKFRES